MADRSKILPLAAGAGFLLVLPLFFMDWSGGGEYPRLESAARVVRYMSAPRQLKRSSFMGIFPEAQPSDFVNWMFSELGAAEWPPSEGMLMDEQEERAIKALGTPLLPPDVEIRNSPNPKGGRQLVVRADDARRVIIVEGYLSLEHSPVVVQEWAFQWPGKAN